MNIRQRRYDIELKTKSRQLNVGLIVRLAVIAAVIVAAVCIVNYAVERNNIRSSYLAGRETITVGIRTDVYPFGHETEDTVEGFDRDVTETLIKNIFGDEVNIEYRPVWSENAGASIKYGQVDMAVGLIVRGTDKVEGFVVSDPYYTDYAVSVTKRGTVESGSDLAGKKTGVLNSMINLSTINDYLSSSGAANATVARYYDYESAKNDLSDASIDAFILPRAEALQYFSDGFTVNELRLFPVGYSVVFKTTAAGIGDVFSSEINRLKSDGTIDKLAEKWQLSD